MLLLATTRAARCLHLRKPCITGHLVKPMSTKLKPNLDDSALDYDSYYQSIEEVPKSVIYVDTNYCLINKPAHVRMSGNFNVTVEKLMLRWLKGTEVKDLKWIHQLDYATSGVLCVGLNRRAAGLASCSFASRDVQKQYLAVLQGRVDISAYPLLETKPVFLEGDDDTASINSATASKRKHEDPVGATEQRTAPTDAKEAETTWQAEVMETNLRLCYEAFCAWKADNADQGCASDSFPNTADSPPSTHFTQYKAQHPDKWSALQKLADLTYADFQRNAKHRKALRKFLKSCGVDVEVQDSHHSALPELFAEKEKQKMVAVNSVTTEFHISEETVAKLREEYMRPADAPRVFRMKRDVPSGCRLVIHIPVAEIPGDFRMEPGHAGNPGKMCETELEILENGTYKGMEVTKVRLLPRTGRRHQLRVHSMCLGHPIVGDFTYNPVHRAAVILDDAAKGAAQTERKAAVIGTVSTSDCAAGREGTVDGAACGPSAVPFNGAGDKIADRMMLHAHRLRVNYYENSAKVPHASLNPRMAAIIQQNFPNHSECLNYHTRDLSLLGRDIFASNAEKEDKVIIQGQAPDPFVFADGALIPVL